MDEDPLRTSAPSALSPGAIAALYRGNKIETIKMVRQEQNLGLKEAQDAVEQYLAGQPSLQSTIEAAQSDAKESFWLWLVLTIVLAMVAYHWLVAP